MKKTLVLTSILGFLLFMLIAAYRIERTFWLFNSWDPMQLNAWEVYLYRSASILLLVYAFVVWLVYRQQHANNTGLRRSLLMIFLALCALVSGTFFNYHAIPLRDALLIFGFGLLIAGIPVMLFRASRKPPSSINPLIFASGFTLLIAFALLYSRPDSGARAADALYQLEQHSSKSTEAIRLLTKQLSKQTLSAQQEKQIADLARRSDTLVNRIESIKKQLIVYAEGDASELEKKLNDYTLIRKGHYLFTGHILLDQYREDGGKSEELRLDVEAYHQFLKGVLEADSTPNQTKIQALDSLLTLDPQWSTLARLNVRWERRTFYHKSLISILTQLTQLEQHIRTAEMLVAMEIVGRG